VLEGPHGRGQEVKAQDVGTGLSDYRTLRRDVVNSCEGPRTGLTDPYAGTAQTLVQQAVPAVIAMQFEITDQAAIDFSNRFDAAIADSYPVEAATAEARKTVKNSPNPVEWATPSSICVHPTVTYFTSPYPPPSRPPRMPTISQRRRVGSKAALASVGHADPALPRQRACMCRAFCGRSARVSTRDKLRRRPSRDRLQPPGADVGPAPRRYQLGTAGGRLA
jgi:hypothetical protein